MTAQHDLYTARGPTSLYATFPLVATPHYRSVELSESLNEYEESRTVRQGKHQFLEIAPQGIAHRNWCVDAVAWGQDGNIKVAVPSISQ